MKKIFLRRLTLLSLAGLLAMASPASAVVFCVGNNGHSAIEELSSPCCDDGGGVFAPTEILEPSDTHHRGAACGPCVDFQVTPQSRLEAPAGSAIQHCAAPLTLAADPTLDLLVGVGTHDAAHLVPELMLELLASVILLT